MPWAPQLFILPKPVLPVLFAALDVDGMERCLTDQDLAALIQGSAAPKQIAAWKQHVEGCESCASRLAKTRIARVDQDGWDLGEKPGDCYQERLCADELQ